MNKALYFVMFAAGVAIGAVVTHKYLYEKCEQRTQDEIDSVKEAFRKKRGVTRSEEKKQPTESKEYEEILQKHAYNGEHRPYVISPEEFGEEDEYDIISLTYFDDGVLADDNLDIIENVDEIIGLDSLRRFGEYENDSVFVRNDDRKCDYEILLDKQTYKDVLESVPYKR